MTKFKLSNNARNAMFIGSTCSLSYLAVYFARNVLGTATPSMIEGGNFTTESIGSLSSIFFITYAVGQLINGLVGDKIKARNMMCLGLLMAGVCNLIFALFPNSMAVSYISYGMTGFFLSMIYAPMTKLVAENTEPIHAARCSLGYTFASFIGSPMAGIFAMFFAWQGVFYSSSIFLFLMAAATFFVLHLLEKKGIVKYNQYFHEKGEGNSIKILIKHDIIKFTLISILTGVIRTTVVFWLPTYLSQYLGYSSEKSALLFTISSLGISSSAFIAMFIYERIRRNMNVTLIIAFAASAASFALLYFIKHPIINIVVIVLGIIAANCASTMLWSVYCPSLKDTGMVSSATGFLDFVSYMAASISSTLFANSVSTIGWSGLILVWFALMLLGTVICLPFKKKQNA